MIGPPTTFLGLLGALLGLFFLGLALWGVGQWLRRRGHSDTLDKIDVHVTKVQRGAIRVLGLFGGLLTGLGRAISRTPLLGSRRQRDMWDDLHDHGQGRHGQHQK